MDKTDILDTIQKSLQAIKDNKTYNKLSYYKPYGLPETLNDSWSCKPWQLDFHNAGSTFQERALVAGNRIGKSQTNFAEVAIHMTGLYPKWWKGKRFKKNVLVWTGSPTNETSRDIVQESLLGGIGETLGTGWIPRHLIVGIPKMRKAGISDVVDSFKVRHTSGALSICISKTYEQGWRKWQGTQPDIVALDEEPEDNEIQGKIYTEALTRVLTSHGIIMVTFTPLLGITKLVEHFMSKKKGVYMDGATWDDAPHLDKEERDRLKNSYPDYEVQARTMGIPMMGEGRIFTTSEDEIKCPPFEIPSHYARICGLDFGLDHPFAAAWLAWDRDLDVIYLYDCYKKRGEQSVYHAEMIKSRGSWIPVAWPHDGVNREKGSGIRLCDFYRKYGVKMLGRSARYKNDRGGSQPVWPVIEELIDRMKTGRFQVFSTCRPFWDEFRSYHTKDGKINARNDDTLKAVFYAVMMRRYACVNRGVYSNNNAPRLMSMRL